MLKIWRRGDLLIGHRDVERNKRRVQGGWGGGENILVEGKEEKNKPEVVWEQTNTCEKEHKELSWQKSRIFFIFFLPHVKDRTFWKLWEFYVTSSLDRFS